MIEQRIVELAKAEILAGLEDADSWVSIENDGS